MGDRESIRERILGANRRLFDEKRHSATPCAEIAGDIDIGRDDWTDHVPIERGFVAAREEHLRAAHDESSDSPNSVR